MKLSKADQFMIAFAGFWILGFIDQALYSFYAFKHGYYFVAPLNFIIHYHSHGIGLMTLCAWIASLLIVVVCWLRLWWDSTGC